MKSEVAVAQAAAVKRTEDVVSQDVTTQPPPGELDSAARAANVLTGQATEVRSEPSSDLGLGRADCLLWDNQG